MTSTAIPPAAGPRNLIHDASSLIQWQSNVGKIGRLGCAFPTASCLVFSSIGFDDSQQTAFFRISVPVSLKNAGGKRTPLYISIEPEQISDLQRLPLDNSEATQLGLNALVAHSKECSSPNDVMALQFNLKRCVTIVGSNGITALTPKSDAAGKILESLHSLSLATNITVYFLNTKTLARHVNELCNNAQQGRLFTPKQLRENTLFGGAGGVDVSGLLARFGADDSREVGANLPSYNELSSTPQSISRPHQRRPSGSSNSNSPRSRRIEPVSAVDPPPPGHERTRSTPPVDPPLPRYERTPSASPFNLPPQTDNVSAAGDDNRHGEDGEEEEQNGPESEEVSTKRKREANSIVESQATSSPVTGLRRDRRKRVRFHTGEGSTQTRSNIHFSTPESLREDLADFIEWLSCVDVTLRKKYDDKIWRLGDAAYAGNGVEFHRLVAECQAEVVTRYRRRTKDE